MLRPWAAQRACFHPVPPVACCSSSPAWYAAGDLQEPEPQVAGVAPAVAQEVAGARPEVSGALRGVGPRPRDARRLHGPRGGRKPLPLSQWGRERDRAPPAGRGLGDHPPHHPGGAPSCPFSCPGSCPLPWPLPSPLPPAPLTRDRSLSLGAAGIPLCVQETHPRASLPCHCHCAWVSTMAVSLCCYYRS